MRRMLALIVALMIACAMWGAAPAPAADHVLLIGGQGGEPDYQKDFLDTLQALRGCLVDQGYAPERIRMLADAEADTPNLSAPVKLESLGEAMDRLAADVKSSDTLLLVMIGHGQSDFTEAKFNLPGADLTAEKLGEWLGRIPARDQRLILAFACSGHFSQLLTRPGRAIFASCDGPREMYHTVVPHYLLDALREGEADLDRDQTISLYEIYRFIGEKVGAFYKSNGLIATEHPSLEDNGDGAPTTLTNDRATTDGATAGRLRIAPAPDSSNPVLKKPVKSSKEVAALAADDPRKM